MCSCQIIKEFIVKLSCTGVAIIQFGPIIRHLPDFAYKSGVTCGESEYRKQGSVFAQAQHDYYFRPSLQIAFRCRRR